MSTIDMESESTHKRQDCDTFGEELVKNRLEWKRQLYIIDNQKQHSPHRKQMIRELALQHGTAIHGLRKVLFDLNDRLREGKTSTVDAIELTNRYDALLLEYESDHQKYADEMEGGVIGKDSHGNSIYPSCVSEIVEKEQLSYFRLWVQEAQIALAISARILRDTQRRQQLVEHEETIRQLRYTKKKEELGAKTKINRESSNEMEMCIMTLKVRNDNHASSVPDDVMIIGSEMTSDMLVAKELSDIKAKSKKRKEQQIKREEILLKMEIATAGNFNCDILPGEVPGD